MGKNSCLGDGVIVYCLGEVAIGQRVSVSQYAHICAGSHDYKDESMPLLRLPISIGDDVWIATEAFVGPNVTMGKSAILGARAVTMRDLEANSIYMGNPATKVKDRDNSKSSDN